MKGILTINRNIMRLSGKVSLNKLAKQSNVIAFKSDSTDDGGGGVTVFDVCGIEWLYIGSEISGDVVQTRNGSTIDPRQCVY